MHKPQFIEQPVTRRRFLKSTLAGTIALGATSQLFGKDPDSSKTPLKLSLAAYSFNRELPRNWPTPRASSATMTLMDFVDFCGTQDLDGTELTSYYFPKQVTEEYLDSLKAKIKKLGLEISGTAIGNDFCLPKGEARDQQLALTRQWVDYAAAMGAPVIRIFAGKVPKGGTEAGALDACVAGINESVAYAAEKKVTLALENHGGITATPEQLLKIVDRVEDSPYFGINFDSGNFKTKDPYGDLAKIAPLAVNAQVKVVMAPEGKEKQPADIPRIVEILKTADYSGYVVLEYEEKEDPRVEIPKYLKQLRELL